MKLFFSLLLLSFILSTSTMNAQSLSQYQWKNRILIVNFDESSQKNYQSQIRDLQNNRSGLAERKLIIIQICEDQYRMGTDDDSVWQKADSALLEKIKKAPEQNLSVALIGLDGGIKVRKSTIFTVKELFEIIDAMPVRARELKNN